MASRMEAALWTQHDIKSLEEKKKSLKEEIKQLKKLTGKKEEDSYVGV